MFCSLRRKYQKKEIQFHWNEIQLKGIASFLRFQFSFESNFCCSFCVVVLSFCFSLLQRKKRKSDIFLTSSRSYYASYFLKKKKKKRVFILLPLRFVISSIYFFKNIFRRSFRALILSVTVAPFLNKKEKKKRKTKPKKEKKNLDASNFLLWRFYSHW